MAYTPGKSDLPLDETSEGVDKRRAMRLLAAGIAIVVAVVFMSQNNDKVELNFLMFSVSARLWVGMLATLVLGCGARTGRRGALGAPQAPPRRERLTCAGNLPVRVAGVGFGRALV